MTAAAPHVNGAAPRDDREARLFGRLVQMVSARDYAGIATTSTALQAIRSGPRKRPSASSAVLALLEEGPIRRLKTGIATLDEITRGGLMFGKATVIGGAPNAGKTTLAIQFGHSAARAGLPVAIHCADVDDREAIACRIGQAEGLVLADLENREPGAVRWLAGVLAEMPNLIIRDQDEDEAFLEDTVDELVAAVADAGAPGVLVIDSLQKTRSRLGADAETETERVQANMAIMKAAMKRHKLLVIATSELARAAYRNRRQAENCADISAFKHSGDIEHATAVALVLRDLPDQEDERLVGVAIAKNKRGLGDRPCCLKHDHARCLFAEVPMPEGPGVDRDRTEDERMQAGRARVLRAIKRNSSLRTKNDVHGKAKGTKAVNLKALDELLEDGAVVVVDGCYRLATEARPTGESPRHWTEADS